MQFLEHGEQTVVILLFVCVVGKNVLLCFMYFLCSHLVSMLGL